jgi:hypothetical protein
MRRLKNHTAYFLFFLGLTLSTANLPPAQAQAITLNGVVIDDSGLGVQAVEVNLKGDGVEQRVLTDKNGKFTFEIPAGKYALVFRSPGYYETVIKDLDIWKQPLDSLTVVLPKLTLKRDLELISGVVLRESETPVEGMEVHLMRGGVIYQTTSTNKEGEFKFEVSVGKYDLLFQYPGYYEMTVKDVDIWKQPRDSLKILLPKLTLEPDLEIIGPQMVPAPALEVSFKPTTTLKVGRLIKGTLYLKNTGKEPILIPTALYTQESQYSPEARIMWISVEVEGYYAQYYQPHICLPAKDCRQLKPGETISFPVSIYNRERYEEGKREIQAYHKRGDNKLKVWLQFNVPSPGEDVRTKPIEKEFRVFVQP